MTAFISEFRSMTFQCKSEISSAIQFSEVNSYNHTMAPHQHEVLAKGSDQVLAEAERSRETQVSPVSSLGGTSVESSSPVTPSMTTSNGMNRNYEIDRAHMVDPSSDDSGSMTNDIAGYQEMPSPLEQLQCALGKDGMLGQKLHLSDYPGQKDDVRNGSNASLSPAEQQPCIYFDSNELYKCHLCSYASNSKQDFNVHMNSHFDYKCTFCDYTSRTEGRLKRHVKDFHSETPPESWAGTRIPRAELSGAEQSMDDSVTSSNGKSRTYRCKQCDFVAYQKNDFWEHNKSHIKADKLLTCPKCAFVTEYKHHLEYHIRNHFGSKPFKCSKCNYSCVNKSMLNSHMKSHSNIYQYRCANCTYATKYCHSLKLHLRKYDHKPATVLNIDGTPNPYPVIDVYGTRRGPRTKKRRCMDDSENTSVSSTAAVSSQPSLSFPSNVPLLSTNVPVMYPTQFYNGYPTNLYMKSHQTNDNPNFPMGISNVRVKSDGPFKCIICDFITDHQEIFHKHMILHAAAENQDLIKLYGINSESLLHYQDQLMFNTYLQNQKYLENHSISERRNFEDFDQQKRMSNGYLPEAKAIKYEEDSSNTSEKSDKNQYHKYSAGKDYSSAQTAQDFDFKDGKGETTDDSERTVIVAHKSSPKPLMALEAMDKLAPQPQNKNLEHSPLDLSGSKPSDSSQKPDGIKTPEANFENEDIKNVSPNGSDYSANQRNRRKGKAFKIDHYIQLDQVSKSGTSTPIGYPVHQEESQLNHATHSPHDRAQPLMETVVTKDKKLQEMSQNVPYHQLKPMEISRQNSSPLHSHDLGRSNNECDQAESRKSCSPVVFKDSIQHSQHMHLNESQNSTAIQGLQSKVEVEFEQKSNPTKGGQEVFECQYCAMTFKDITMYTVHMGYHGFGDPFTCNMCGKESKDRVEFFIHMARYAHV